MSTKADCIAISDTKRKGTDISISGIPKIIHYCWFGGNPLPDLAVKCINSWKKFFPDYDIKEWNETNFDVECCDYVSEAYAAKKWAFVSDYARFWILYHEGGLYFDTDVEVIKSFDDILAKGAFMGCEEIGKVNPGLGIGVKPGNRIYREILDLYQSRHFISSSGEIDTTTIVEHTTNTLLKCGLDKKNGEIQEIADIVIYPPDFFCPMDFWTGKLTVTSQTHSIHHFVASWISKKEGKILKLNRICVSIFGKKYGRCVCGVITFPLRLISRIRKTGIKETLRFARYKLNSMKKRR